MNVADTVSRWTAVFIFIAALIIAGAGIRWHWRECRQVGHGVLFCISEASR